MLKAAGLVGIVISLGMYGVLKSDELKQRIMLLQDFLQFMLQMKSEISYLQEPLQSILRQRKSDEKSKALQMLFMVQQKLENEGTDLQGAWGQSVRAVYHGMPLTPQDIDLFCYPGSFLGQTDCENQLQQFQYFENCLQAQIQEAEKNYRTKGPLRRRIGFFVGGLIAVVLL